MGQAGRYKSVIVETYLDGAKVRVRPVAGQPYPRWIDVECSKSMRKSHPLGTRFRILVKSTDREGGRPFLYSHYKWPYEVVE